MRVRVRVRVRVRARVRARVRVITVAPLGQTAVLPMTPAARSCGYSSSETGV